MDRTLVSRSSPAAVVEVKADGDLGALADWPQRVDVQVQHAVLDHMTHLRKHARSQHCLSFSPTLHKTRPTERSEVIVPGGGGVRASYLSVGGTRPPDEARLVAKAAGVDAHLQPVELGVEQHEGVRPAAHTETQTLPSHLPELNTGGLISSFFV